MNIYQLLSGLNKCCEERNQVCNIATFTKKSGGIILTLLTIVFSYCDMNAQHLFSISYNGLSKENAKKINTQINSSGFSITSLKRNLQDEYVISLSTVQNTKVIVINEETGNNVVITPMEASSAQLRLQSFFIEELRKAVLGDVNKYGIAN